MSSLIPEKSRVGVIGLAYPGYCLGEEMCAPKLAEMQALLRRESVEAVSPDLLVRDEASARQVGEQMARAKVDCLLAVVTTFVPDYFMTELLAACDAPVFIWAVEREIQCLSLVCGPLITATLFNLGKPYRLHGADIGEPAAMESFRVFARAAMLRRLLGSMRVGYCGGKPSIMFSLAVDEYALSRRLGVTVVNLSIEDLYRAAKEVSDSDAKACWDGIRTCAGEVCVREADGVGSARYYLAARTLAAGHRLDALSLNCFPHLKSQVCLAVARLNDDGIAAACEGDLHSTILMALLSRLTGRAAFNGDFLRLYPEDHAILFSHCGAGAFSLAAGKACIRLHASIETRDGLAIRYPTSMPGPVTLLNLMAGNGQLRLAAMAGVGVKTDLSYEGTPLRVRFEDDVRAVLQRLARCGAGHHWNGAAGDLAGEFVLLCEWTGITFNPLTESNG